jgi:ribosomal protein L17
MASRIDHHADSRLELDLVSPAKALEIRRGDVVKAGLHIEHSRYGDHATQVHAFIYRLICANGMTRRECVSAEGIVRTRKLPADHPRAKELLLDQVRRLTARTWEKLESQLTELRSTSERRASVQELLRQWLQRARISTRVTGATPPRTVMDRLLTAWRAEGAEDTTYAAVNALTSVGSHDTELTSRQRRLLSSLGGLLAFSGLHICPRCFSVLSSPAEVREDHAAEAAITYSRNE